MLLCVLKTFLSQESGNPLATGLCGALEQLRQRSPLCAPGTGLQPCQAQGAVQGLSVQGRLAQGILVRPPSAWSALPPACMAWEAPESLWKHPHQL